MHRSAQFQKPNSRAMSVERIDQEESKKSFREGASEVRTSLCFSSLHTSTPKQLRHGDYIYGIYRNCACQCGYVTSKNSSHHGCWSPAAAAGTWQSAMTVNETAQTQIPKLGALKIRCGVAESCAQLRIRSTQEECVPCRDSVMTASSRRLDNDAKNYHTL